MPESTVVALFREGLYPIADGAPHEACLAKLHRRAVQGYVGRDQKAPLRRFANASLPCRDNVRRELESYDFIIRDRWLQGELDEWLVERVV